MKKKNQINQTLKPIFQQSFCGRDGAGNAIYFALGKLQIHFSQINISTFKKHLHIQNTEPQMFLILNKQSLWNIDRIIRLHVPFTYVDFDCQRKAKTTPSGI